MGRWWSATWVRHSRLQGLLVALFFSQPPHLAVEIVSPDDGPGDMLGKVAEYLNFGVPHVWIPDPYRPRLQEADQ